MWNRIYSQSEHELKKGNHRKTIVVSQHHSTSQLGDQLLRVIPHSLLTCSSFL